MVDQLAARRVERHQDVRRARSPVLRPAPAALAADAQTAAGPPRPPATDRPRRHRRRPADRRAGNRPARAAGETCPLEAPAARRRHDQPSRGASAAWIQCRRAGRPQAALQCGPRQAAWPDRARRRRRMTGWHAASPRPARSTGASSEHDVAAARREAARRQGRAVHRPLPIPDDPAGGSASSRLTTITPAPADGSSSTARARTSRGGGQAPSAATVASSARTSTTSPLGAIGPRSRKRQSSVCSSRGAQHVAVAEAERRRA